MHMTCINSNFIPYFMSLGSKGNNDVQWCKQSLYILIVQSFIVISVVLLLFKPVLTSKNPGFSYISDLLLHSFYNICSKFAFCTCCIINCSVAKKLYL